MKINVGCGPQIIEGYIGVDIIRTRGSNVVADGLMLPFKTDTIDAIYTSHTIEHFSRADLPRLLKEWARVIHSGGILEIMCPDMEKAMRRWLKGDFHYRWGFGITTLFGKQTNKGHFHYNGFTKKLFEKILPRRGFVIDIIRNQPNKHKRDRRLIPDGDIYVRAVRK